MDLSKILLPQNVPVRSPWRPNLDRPRGSGEAYSDGQGMNSYSTAPVPTPPHVHVSALARRPDGPNPFQNEIPSMQQTRPVHVPVEDRFGLRRMLLEVEFTLMTKIHVACAVGTLLERRRGWKGQDLLLMDISAYAL
ncbi:hypothetical protein C8J56DRAFT_900697 [Mycena floridula]|nr:hypothetical protein C8J56DRAFT_900697 [Mycena floridula]